MKSLEPEIKVTEDTSLDTKFETPSEYGSSEQKEGERSNEEIESTTKNVKDGFERYIDDLCHRIVDEANLEATSKLKEKLAFVDREKHSKKFVIHSFSIPYRPSTQPTTFGPVFYFRYFFLFRIHQNL